MATSTRERAIPEPRAAVDGVTTPRKIAGGLVMAVGVVFLVVAFMNNLFEVGPAFEEMIDDFRPILAEEPLATAQADIDMLEAAGVEFQSAVAPGMADALGMTPEQFGAFVGTEFPAVATGMQELPTIAGTFTGLVNMLDEQRLLFASADEIPTKDLPATTVPWSIAAVGVISILAGAAMFMRSRRWVATAAVLGALLIVVPLILTLPTKSADADDLNDALRPVYNQELIDGAQASLATVGAMGTQLQDGMLPALSTSLNMTGEELQQFLGTNFPATATALQGMPSSMERFEGFTAIFATNLDNYETVEPVAFTPIIWTLIIGGIVILLAGGYCLVAKQ